MSKRIICSESALYLQPIKHRCKKRFLRFFILAMFCYVFKRFFLFSQCYFVYFKRSSEFENSTENVEKGF